MLTVDPLILRCFGYFGWQNLDSLKYRVPPGYSEESMEIAEKCLKSISLETGIGERGFIEIWLSGLVFELIPAAFFFL